MVRDRLGVGERWACRVLGQHRSTERYEPKRAEDDAVLRAELRQFSKDRPPSGCRRAHRRLRELGWDVNRKRVQRLWREKGCGCRSGGASAGGWGTRPSLRSACAPSGPTRGRRSTSSSTRPPTAGY